MQPAEQRPALRDLLTAFGQAYHKLLSEGSLHGPTLDATEEAITDLFRCTPVTSKTASLLRVANLVVTRISAKGGYFEIYDAAKAALALPDETSPVPHHVEYDRLGWLCSMCGGWNNQYGVSCQHDHSALKTSVPISSTKEKDDASV